jgi:hypothetical protein
MSLPRQAFTSNTTAALSGKSISRKPWAAARAFSITTMTDGRIFSWSIPWTGQDISPANPSPRSITIIGDGTFTDVTRQAGLAVEMYGLGCAVGDYDNDGYVDIYITTVGSNHLFTIWAMASLLT